MAQNYPPHAAHFDANQVPSSMGVIGVQGTADTQGTAQPLPASVDAQTGGWNVVRIGAVGSVLTTAVNIGTTGTAALPTTALANRKAMFFYNAGTSSVAYGGTGLTYAGGIPVGTGDESRALSVGTAQVFAIAQTAGGTVIVFEIS